MGKLGYLWGLQHNVKGTEKQRGNSGARESVARPRVKQRRILPRAECMNRITMAGVGMANKKERRLIDARQCEGIGRQEKQ